MGSVSVVWKYNVSEIAPSLFTKEKVLQLFLHENYKQYNPKKNLFSWYVLRDSS